MYWYGHGLGWGGMIFGWLMMLLLWGSLIILIIWAARSITSRGGDQTKKLEPGAREILDRRYAKGEISREEYKSMKEDLKQ